MTLTAILPECGLVEGTADGAVETARGGLVNLGAQGTLELFVGLVGAGEVGVADEKTLAVVVGVDEPTGDVVGRRVADLAGRRVVHVQSLDLDGNLPAFPGFDLHV